MAEKITKNELDDIFYQGGPLEEPWEESDYDAAIRRVWDEARNILYNELIEEAYLENWDDVALWLQTIQGE